MGRREGERERSEESMKEGGEKKLRDGKHGKKEKWK